jgi:nicotinate-nucleotide--dimethylbenzimidazole phosphoribosyltransferase
VLDGFITGVAALVACERNPSITRFLVAGHVSAERAHRGLLQRLGLRPLLDLDMRLGEGTGAAIGISLVESAVRLYREMATFESAGVSTDASSIDEVPPPDSPSGAVR